MAALTGLSQFFDWGASSITTSGGKVTGGDMPLDPQLADREGIGAQAALVGGPLKPGGNVSMMVQQETVALLAYALRGSYTTPTLTSFIVAGGLQGNGRTQTGCLVNKLTLKCSIGEPLTADIEWLALTDAAYTSARQTVLTTATYEWFQGTCTLNTENLLMQSFEITVNNNLEHLYSLDANSTNSMRYPDSIKVGSSEITGSFDVLTRPGTTAAADTLADTVATNIAASCAVKAANTVTIALANCSRSSISEPFERADGLVTYRVGLRAPKNTAALTISAA
jgi:hypothetical protein